MLSAFEVLNGKDVPDDGQRFGVVGAPQWNELLNLPEFSDSDYTGNDLPWLKGSKSRKWLGIVWIMHTGLPLANTNDRDVFLFHKTAVGHAIGKDVTTDNGHDIAHGAIALLPVDIHMDAEAIETMMRQRPWQAS